MYAAAQKGKDYFAGLDAARSSAPYVGDFVRLFPDAQVNSPMSCYSGAKEPQPGFNLVAILHERYELTMQLPVDFDADGRTVVGYGEPAFYLVEARSVEGRSVSYTSSGERHFGSAEWRQIVAADGDFGAIGYRMVKDRPVPGFESLMTPVGKELAEKNW